MEVQKHFFKSLYEYYSKTTPSSEASKILMDGVRFPCKISPFLYSKVFSIFSEVNHVNH